MKKPHILIFNPDEMRADTMGHLGNPAAITPNLDSFATRDAVSFANAHCQNTVCVPSRCSFFTGLYPHVRGHRTMSHLLHKNESSLFSELKASGWYVWMNSRNDLIDPENIDNIHKHCDVFFQGGQQPAPKGPENPDIRGRQTDPSFYSFYRGRLGLDNNGKNYSSDDEAVDEAIRVIKNPPTDKPMCLFLGLFYPHVPYQVEEPYFSAIDKSKLPPRLTVPKDLGNHPLAMQLLHQNNNLSGLTEDQWDQIRSCYLAMTMKVDTQFGRVCQALKDAGIYDDTDIYVLSDHGDFTGDYGLVEKAQNLMPDCLTRVPLLIKPHKGVTVNPGISGALTELVDFYATAMDLAGVMPDHTHFGHSLRPQLKDPSIPNRRYVFNEGGRTNAERANCTESLKAGRDELFWPRFTAQIDDTAHGKATMIRSENHKYIRRIYEKDEFYDLVKDPGELKNEIDNPIYKDIIAEMKIQMLDWYQKTCDIVPLKKDSVFSKVLILEKAKNVLTLEKLEEFVHMLDSEEYNMIMLCNKFGVRII